MPKMDLVQPFVKGRRREGRTWSIHEYATYLQRLGVFPGRDRLRHTQILDETTPTVSGDAGVVDEG
jgi:hypothetical protein